MFNWFDPKNFGTGLRYFPEKDRVDAVVCSKGEIPEEYAHHPLLNEGFEYKQAHQLGLEGVIIVYDVYLKDTRKVNVGNPDPRIRSLQYKIESLAEDLAILEDIVTTYHSKCEACGCFNCDGNCECLKK